MSDYSETTIATGVPTLRSVPAGCNILAIKPLSSWYSKFKDALSVST